MVERLASVLAAFFLRATVASKFFEISNAYRGDSASV
jgi:hypothetical protein